MYSSNSSSNRTFVVLVVASVILLLGLVDHHDNNNNDNSHSTGGLAFVSAKSNDFLPKKNWATIGYESFFGKRAEKGAVAKSSADGKKKLVPKPPPTSTPTKSISKKKKGTGSDDAPNPVTKALLGVAVAATAAAIGGKALSDGEMMRPELALVESLRKPIVARNVPMPPRTIKTTEDGATIPNEVFNLGASFYLFCFVCSVVE